MDCRIRFRDTSILPFSSDFVTFGAPYQKCTAIRKDASCRCGMKGGLVIAHPFVEFVGLFFLGG